MSESMDTRKGIKTLFQCGFLGGKGGNENDSSDPAADDISNDDIAY
jgi:hypothetical protein